MSDLGLFLVVTSPVWLAAGTINPLLALIGIAAFVGGLALVLIGG